MPYTPIPTALFRHPPRAIWKLANDMYIAAATVEALQPVPAYAATLAIVQSTCSIGKIVVWVEGSDDRENWSVIGASSLITQIAVATSVAELTSGALGARFCA